LQSQWLINCISSPRVRMKTVQLAIQDPEYADSLRDVLQQDVKRQVHLVASPDLDLPGVIIVDASQLQDLPLLKNEPNRLIVLVAKGDDLSKVWDAGVRHVVFHGDPPETTNTVILGMELSLGASVPA
jgi:hypothetical protein